MLSSCVGRFDAYIISILIAAIMVISTLPQSASAYSGYDYASGVLGDRLNSIIQNGISGFVSPKIPAVGGRLNNSQWYTTSYANQSGSSQDKQCQAYARAAYSNLFGYNLATETYRVTFSDARARNYLDESLFRKYGVRCGAYLRTTDSSSGKYNGNKGHSIIILSYNSSGVITLEGNADGKGKVAITNYSWSSFNSMAFRRHNYYVCSFSQPTDAIYASLGSSSTPNPPPPSTPTLVSQTEGYWEVTIPANYNLLLYSSPDAASNLTNSKASSESYPIRVTNEARLSDGTVRYGRIWNHKGTDMMLWFTLTGSVTVEDVSHTTHVKGEFIRSDDVHPHYNYYRCSVCGEEFSDGSTSTAQNCSQCGTDLRIVSQEEVNWSIGIPANYVVEVYSEATATKWSFCYASYPETRYMRTAVRAEMSDGSIRFQEAGSEDRWFIFADGMQIDTHTPGEVVYTKSEHPHENQVECAVCGLLYWDGSTTPNDSCTICNPEAEVISRESGKWEVTIPAYYFLQFYDTETTRKTGSYYDAKDAAYVLTSTERVTLSNGEVRYYFFHENDSGQTWSLWYIFTGNMTVEDVSHTVHTWDLGIITHYPTLDTEGVRT